MGGENSIMDEDVKPNEDLVKEIQLVRPRETVITVVSKFW